MLFKSRNELLDLLYNFQNQYYQAQLRNFFSSFSNRIGSIDPHFGEQKNLSIPLELAVKITLILTVVCFMWSS